MALFFVGILEMLITTCWTKIITRSQIAAGGVVTMINVLIWYYVLQKVVDQIENWGLVLLYALGCAIGTVISMTYFRHRELKKGQAPEGKTI